MNFIRAVLGLFIYFLVLGIPLMCLNALLKYVFKVKNVKRMQMHDNLIADFNNESQERNLKFLDDMKEVKRMLNDLDKDIENAKKDL